MRTYLIEPQTVFVPFLQRVLAKAGYDVVATSASVDGKDISSHDPAAIFVDVDYLERSAPTVLCRIREIARNARLIALSESTDSLFTAACLISGANVVFSKNDGEENLLRGLQLACGAAT